MITLSKKILLLTICLSVAHLAVAQTQSDKSPQYKAPSSTLTWFSTNEFLETQASNFVVSLNAKFIGENIEISINSENPGNVFVFGVSSVSHDIYPLCDDYSYVNKGQPTNFNCESDVFTQLKGEKLIFAFVVDSEQDIKKIRRFMQLRTGLPENNFFKGVYFHRPEADFTTVNAQDAQEHQQHNCSSNSSELGIAYVSTSLI